MYWISTEVIIILKVEVNTKVNTEAGVEVNTELNIKVNTQQQLGLASRYKRRGNHRRKH